MLCVSAGFCLGMALHRWFGRILGRRPAGTRVILCYHTVGDDERARFLQQMDLLSKFARPVAVDKADSMANGNHYAAVTFDDGFQSVYENALPALVARKIPATIFITAGYIGLPAGWADEPWDPTPDEPLMTEEQIRSLPGEWITVGSHSMTHPELCSLDDAQIEMELVESKRRLQSITGRPVSIFSVPYNRGDARVAKKVMEAGYTKLFGGMAEPNAGPDAGYVRRIRVSPSDWGVEFRLKLLGAYRWFPVAVRMKRAIPVLNGGRWCFLVGISDNF